MVFGGFSFSPTFLCILWFFVAVLGRHISLNHHWVIAVDEGLVEVGGWGGAQIPSFASAVKVGWSGS